MLFFCAQKCPLLLRVFINNNGRHHHMNEFSRGSVPSKEVQVPFGDMFLYVHN